MQDCGRCRYNLSTVGPPILTMQGQGTDGKG
jgi:hypothetical protein